MDGAIRPQDGPAAPLHPIVNLRKPLAAVKGLIVLTSWVAQERVDFIKAHKIKIVRGRQEKFSSATCNAVHLADGILNLR